MRQKLRASGCTLAIMAMAVFTLAHAQTPVAPTAGIYTCVDSHGRNLTSDRPIAACSDREQRVLGGNGATRGMLEPNYSAKELAVRAEKVREAELIQMRRSEDQRRDRALVLRYPSPVVHDRVRSESLEQIDVVINAALKRMEELAQQRKTIDDELEFYVTDPQKAPQVLRHQADDNAQAVLVQKRFIAEQQAEKDRVNARFDEQASRLRQLWQSMSEAAQR
ncbi:MAG: DUF4124 domain-containing protein [Variovorax sp.]